MVVVGVLVVVVVVGVLVVVVGVLVVGVVGGWWSVWSASSAANVSFSLYCVMQEFSFSATYIVQRGGHVVCCKRLILTVLNDGI